MQIPLRTNNSLIFLKNIHRKSHPFSAHIKPTRSIEKMTLRYNALNHRFFARPLQTTSARAQYIKNSPIIPRSTSQNFTAQLSILPELQAYKKLRENRNTYTHTLTYPHYSHVFPAVFLRLILVPTIKINGLITENHTNKRQQDRKTLATHPSIRHCEISLSKKSTMVPHNSTAKQCSRKLLPMSRMQNITVPDSELSKTSNYSSNFERFSEFKKFS